MLTTRLRKLTGKITLLLFAFYLIPGPLLHELVDHQDDCDIHASLPEGPAVSTLHRHCELMQLGSPELLFTGLSILFFVEQPFVPLALFAKDEAPTAQANRTFLRGPPALSV